jgi:hypothetical protein
VSRHVLLRRHQGPKMIWLPSSTLSRQKYVYLVHSSKKKNSSPAIICTVAILGVGVCFFL